MNPDDGERRQAEDSSNAKLTAGELEKTPGYVRIRIKGNKRGASVARARIAGQRVIKRAEKKLSELLKGVPDEYLDRALRRLGEQLNATKKIWDLNAKRLIDIPDEKIRQDAALAILAYKWGRPVERAQVLCADAKDFPGLMEKLSQSPAYLEDELCEQKAVEGREIPPALPTPQV